VRRSRSWNRLLASDDSPVFRLTLQPGMGLVCNNVLHDRAGFVDDPLQPRLAVPGTLPGPGLRQKKFMENRPLARVNYA
jgi:hypothetical protein